MTACGALGTLIVGGREVGQVRCQLMKGHDKTVILPATPHRFPIEWTDAEPVPDADLLDPGESFDVDVEG